MVIAGGVWFADSSDHRIIRHSLSSSILPGSNFSPGGLYLVLGKVLYDQQRGGSIRNETADHTAKRPLCRSGIAMSAQEDQVDLLLIYQLMQRYGGLVADEHACFELSQTTGTEVHRGIGSPPPDCAPQCGQPIRHPRVWAAFAGALPVAERHAPEGFEPRGRGPGSSPQAGHTRLVATHPREGVTAGSAGLSHQPRSADRPARS